MPQEQFTQDSIAEEEAKKPDRRRLIIYIVVGVVVICLLCAIAYQFIPSSDDGEEIAGVTSVPTEVIDEELSPEETPLPTEPPPPANTPEPTNTPLPTATPTEVPTPTPLPDPVILTGSGDSVIDFENPFPVSIAHITGNAASTNFIVWNYGEDGTKYDLLVNTTDPYDGVVLMDPGEGEKTTRFEITAVGEWTIVVDALLAARKLEVPGTIEGTDDDVIVLTGNDPDLANIMGNEAATNFIIWGFGSGKDLLVNTVDPYEGTVILARDTVVLEITAVGPWSIEVTE